MKTVKKWVLAGIIETVIACGLVLGAPAVINSGRPMLGFGMFGTAAGGIGVSATYVVTRINSARRAKRILVRAFPDQKDWKALPVADFIDITPEQTVEAITYIREILQDEVNFSDRTAIEGSSIISFIKSFSGVSLLHDGT
jgi:Zn-dependent alcohol dehydrogenase